MSQQPQPQDDGGDDKETRGLIIQNRMNLELDDASRQRSAPWSQLPSIQLLLGFAILLVASGCSLFFLFLHGSSQGSTTMVEVPIVLSSNDTTTTAATATAVGLLRIVSFNVAGGVPSQSAPPSWQRQDQLEAIRSELLLVHQKSDGSSSSSIPLLPHVIALQECESPTWWKTLGLEDWYQSMGSAPSHAGYVTLLIRTDLTAHSVTVSTPGKRRPVPAVAAMVNVTVPAFNGSTETTTNAAETTKITTTTTLPVLIASMHLEPFQSGSARRQEQFERLSQVGPADASLLRIIIGDTNMRDSEDQTTEQQGWRDAWKEAGADASQRYSWNTQAHRQNVSSIGSEDKMVTVQNLYYGSDTRAYTNRYDRCYIGSGWQQQQQQQGEENDGNHPTAAVDVTLFRLIANQPLTNLNHFLSDHFGLWVDLDLSRAI